MSALKKTRPCLLILEIIWWLIQLRSRPYNHAKVIKPSDKKKNEMKALVFLVSRKIYVCNYMKEKHALQLR